jgi:hypothetical protein
MTTNTSPQVGGRLLSDTINRMCADLDRLSRTLRVHNSDANASNAEWLVNAEDTINRLMREADEPVTR